MRKGTGEDRNWDRDEGRASVWKERKGESGKGRVKPGRGRRKGSLVGGRGNGGAWCKEGGKMMDTQRGREEREGKRGKGN